MPDDKLPIDPMRHRRSKLPSAATSGHRRAPVPHRPQAIAAHLVEPAIEDEEDVDLLAYWRLLLKRRWLILGVISTAVALSLVWTLLTPPTYRATAVLQIDSDSLQVMQVQGFSPPPGSYDPEFNQTQYELLRSRALAERVAQDLDLPGSDALARAQAPGWYERLRRLLSPGTPALARDGGPRDSDEEAAVVASADDGAAPSRSSAAELRTAARVIREGLVVEPVRNSHLVRVHYDAGAPALAARVANGLADGFIALTMDRQFGASSYARKYLEDQLAQLRSRLEDSERALVDFAQRENIVPTSDGESLVGKNLADLNESLAKAQDQRIRAEARWKSAQSASGAALPADMLDGSILRTLQEQLAQLQGQYRDKSQTFKPDYPVMLALKGQIDELQAQISKELANIRASVKAEYQAAVSQQQMLEAELESLRSQTLEVDGRSIQYNILKRDVDTNRQLYNALLQRYKEVGVAGGVKSSSISVVDRAEVPQSRYSPSVSRNTALGLLLGTMLGVMLALLLEHLDDTLRAP
ncbi:GumC family protein, partial [Dokdonella sp.]|uniref:GumC family protein n=1 Tax=Dokdonella sp. TaxID=2291710 RepID=UPI002F4234EC